MRYIFILLLSFLHVSASNLLTYNVYEKNNRVDILLSFDSPYNGKILQEKDGNNVRLLLSDLYTNKEINSSINSFILQDLSILYDDFITLIDLKSDAPIDVFAAKTKDGFGLKIGVLLSDLHVNKTQLQEQNNTNNFDFVKFFMFLCIFALIGVILYILRSKKSKFKEPNLLCEKSLSERSKVVLFEFNSYQYLVLVSRGIKVLDKFDKGDSVKITSDDEFQKICDTHNQEIEEYLKTQEDTPLNKYKEKVEKE